MDFEFENEENNPKFNSSMGYLMLLDMLIKLANGFKMNQDLTSYFLTLDCWYSETINRFEENVTKKFNGIIDDDVKKLKNMRLRIINGEKEDMLTLTDYHIQLNYLTHKSKLRLIDNNQNQLYGVMRNQ